MLKMLESLNINNLIYKFQQIQANIEGFAASLKQKKYQPPVLLEFPTEELEQDGDGEVLEILKERRRNMCEFLMKVLNNFMITDVS